MTGTRITLSECRANGRMRNFVPGDYELEYHDATHLPPDQWVRLAVVTVRPTSVPQGEDETEQLDQFYSLRPDLGELPDKPVAKAPGAKGKGDNAPDPAAEYERRTRTVADATSLALARLGLLAPDADESLLLEIVKLNEEDGVVLIPDTNALHNGAMHWLLRVLRRPAIWVLPLVASMTTVQTRDATLKSMLSKIKSTNLRQALRSRGLVNGTLGLIERNRGRMQVVEIDPSLLRYQKMSSSSGSDPDQSDVLEDRLIIEGIHGILRSMRSRTARRVVTSDVNIARVLDAEGVTTLFIPTIALGDRTMDCLRYDPLVGGFVGAPLDALMWEFAHTFGSVRLAQSGQAATTLECYWAGKSPVDWKMERLNYVASTPPAKVEGAKVSPATGSARDSADEVTAVPANAPAPSTVAQATAYDEAVRGIEIAAGNDVAKPASNQGARAATPTPKRRNVAVAPRSDKPAAGAAVLPRASFPQVLRLLGAIRKMRSGTVEDALRISGESVTVDTAKRAIEILKRIKLVGQEGVILAPMADAELVANSLQQGDLDSLSALFERFEPYKAFLAAIQEHGYLARADVIPALKERLGAIGTYEADRLPRFHVLLGQVWSNRDGFSDGSKRPTDRDATDAFAKAFDETASVNLAKVIDLLPRFCIATGQSPWAAKRQIERLIAERMLPEFTFQPAAGGKPVVRDEVVAGRLDELSMRPVAIDRLHLGERPVFTIGGPAR